MVGSNLIKRLLAEGYRVISLDNYFAGSKDAHVDGAEYREGHTKDIEELVPETPDLIYHLGEYSRVEQSVLEPDVVHDLNTVGTAAVVEYWRKRNLSGQECKLLYAGSSTKFGDGGAARHTSPYAATKAANTELVKSVGDSEKLPYAITYFYNVYGPGERVGVYGTIIESFKQMYLRGTPMTVVSPGSQTRNFTHVDDIVDGLVLVGENGEGDEFGLGNEKAYSIIEIAKMFLPAGRQAAGEIVMMPERVGNRMQSGLDTSKARSLGWNPHRSVEEYIHTFTSEHTRGAKLEKRVLVFSTTFHPISGPAEDALCDLMAAMPDVQFDVVTALFSPEAKHAVCPVPNARVHHVGWGSASDKYLLPILGLWRAYKLHRQHRYLFAWALMASYAALAGVLLKRASGHPLLITLADQDLSRVPSWKRSFLRLALTSADQIYGGDAAQEKQASELSARTSLRRSIGDGDAFANAIRFAYSGFVAKRLRSK